MSDRTAATPFPRPSRATLDRTEATERAAPYFESVVLAPGASVEVDLPLFVGPAGLSQPIDTARVQKANKAHKTIIFDFIADPLRNRYLWTKDRF